MFFHRNFQIYSGDVIWRWKMLWESFFFSYHHIRCYSLKCSLLLTGLVKEITILGLSVPVTFKHMRKDWCTLYWMSQSCTWKIWTPFLISSSSFSFNWAINISETVSASQVLHFWLQVVLCISEWKACFFQENFPKNISSHGFACVDLRTIFSCRREKNLSRLVLALWW